MRDRFQDDRTEEQKKTHSVLYGGVDLFLSSWGPPAHLGVKSRAYWACEPEHADRVRWWVSSRSDLEQIQEGRPRWHKNDWVHIYVVGDEHPALKGE